MGERADDVVGLIALDLVDGDLIGLEDALDVGDGGKDALGRLLAVGFVGLVALVAEGAAAGRIKAHGDVRRIFPLEQVLQGVDKAEHGRRVNTGRGDTGTTHHGIKSPKDERICVE